MAIDWDSAELRYSIEVAVGRRLRFQQPFRKGQEHRVELSRGRTDFLTPLFYLSLYSDRFFVVRELLLCERGWECARVRLEDDYEEIGDSEPYEILDDEIERFRRFIRACERVAGLADKWMPLEVAKRHFMAATFAARDPFYAWDASPHDDPPYPDTQFLEGQRRSNFEQNGTLIYEGVLLHYLISLEALLANSLEREARQKILQARIIHLVGRTEEEEESVGILVRKAYELRNMLVHGENLPKLILDLRKLRRICQRACCVVVGLLGSKTPTNNVSDLLRTLDTQSSSRQRVSAIREKMYELIQDSSPLGGKWYISA
jgi:hypothetical protein